MFSGDFNYGKCGECEDLQCVFSILKVDQQTTRTDEVKWLGVNAYSRYLLDFANLANGRDSVYISETDQTFTSPENYADAVVADLASIIRDRRGRNQNDFATTQTIVNSCSGPEEESLGIDGVADAGLRVCASLAALIEIRRRYGS